MTWHKFFESEEAAREKIPLSKTRLLMLDGLRICLARTQQAFFAIDDLCPHLGESLSKGTTNYLNEVVYPWHSYRNNLANGRRPVTHPECQNLSDRNKGKWDVSGRILKNLMLCRKFKIVFQGIRFCSVQELTRSRTCSGFNKPEIRSTSGICIRL